MAEIEQTRAAHANEKRHACDALRIEALRIAKSDTIYRSDIGFALRNHIDARQMTAGFLYRGKKPAIPGMRRDESAILALIQQHNRRLYRIARGIVGNESEA
ncbi:MAG: hypothetical protein J0H62_10000, partial [Rhizobiales bacterium]|nr:hypothetical protein [Hyphomicrobiales bacterium]